MAKLKSIKARRIFDSRGDPMVEVVVTLDDGNLTRAAVPDRGSIGTSKAFDLRYGFSRAVEYINTTIGPALVGKDPTKQAAIDNFMDQQLNGTVNEQKLEENAMLAVSLAVFKAGAAVNEIPLYKKFRILPVGASSFKEAMKMGVRVCHCLKAVIKEIYGQAATKVSDTGGFIQKNKEGLELLKKAIENAGYTDKVVIGMDVAASEFKEENNDGSQNPLFTLCNLYESFMIDHGVASIEVPFDPDDLEHYARMTYEFGGQVQIVGGDLLGTKLVKAINQKTCNAVLLEVDQIGSVTETIEAVKMSKAAGWGVMASCGSLGQQRSIANTFLPKMFCFIECTKRCIGDKKEAFIADLSVGLATGQIKTGATCSRSERRAIYNRLLQIEKELGTEAVYAGADFRKPVEPC